MAHVEERTMGREPCIVVLGDSVLMDSVAGCLAQRRMPGIIRVPCAAIGEQFEFLKPDLILFELGQPCSPQVVALFDRRPDLAMIGLDLESSRVFVVGSYQRVIGSMEDLYQVVQIEVQKRANRSSGGEANGLNWKNHSESRV
jgi:hypothetical protein